MSVTREAIERSLIVEASGALSAMKLVSADLQVIIDGLPNKASRKLREGLGSAKSRLDDASIALDRELDDPRPDIESLTLKARLGRRALQLLSMGALVGGMAAGGGQLAVAYTSLQDNSTVVERHLDALEDCHEEIVSLERAEAERQAQRELEDATSDLQSTLVTDAESESTAGTEVNLFDLSESEFEGLAIKLLSSMGYKRLRHFFTPDQSVVFVVEGSDESKSVVLIRLNLATVLPSEVQSLADLKASEEADNAIFMATSNFSSPEVAPDVRLIDGPQFANLLNRHLGIQPQFQRKPA